MDAILWQERSLSLLDQTKYPDEVVWHELDDVQSVVDILKTPAVAGEAIIASAAAYGYCLAALEYEADPEFNQKLAAAKMALLKARPESQALVAAIKRMDLAYEEYRNSPELITAMLAMAVTIHRQDVVSSRAMNSHGRDIIPDEGKIILSCRGGVFHTGSFGGALGTVRSAAKRGKLNQVYLLENRPGLEGALQIARELKENKVPVTVIADHAAAALMPRQSCDMVLMEGLRVAANGDLLAGPGTYQLAIAAYFHSIQVYAVASTAAIDPSAPNGEAFSQEDGDPASVSQFAGQDILPEGVSAWTPKYDMVPQYLLTGLITEKGILFPPYDETIPEALAKPAGSNAVIL